MTTPSTYDFAVIEPKWQDYWKQNKTFKAIDCDTTALYVLDMFPYLCAVSVDTLKATPQRISGADSRE